MGRRGKGWLNQDPLIWYDANGREMGHPLRDLWRNRAAFLVGGGQSLNDIDYHRLAERGILSLGINNVCGYVPVRAMTFADPTSKFHYGCLYDGAILKLVPKPKLKQKIRLKDPRTREFRQTRVKLASMPSTFGYARESIFRPETFLTSRAASWGNHQAGARITGRPKTVSTLLLGIRLMHYLGVRRVYLLGVDFGMQGTERQQGNYAFAQAGSPTGNNNAYRIVSGWLGELRPIFEADGFHLFNCNPESRLTVFDHVPFETALEDCRSPVPKEPFDLEGWYEESEDKRDKGKSFNPDA